ncbi:hypothetical protein P43SY_004238 [Pythium insidiosum]|uniref:Uncharacterized protein n=1 Tax=Pythium insidiosum TaxID=114742 RepID=A0AAD5LVQ0_PYTIN|nr:hypothetical protein P43SY_004238 [Pythium insidiosum]
MQLLPRWRVAALRSAHRRSVRALATPAALRSRVYPASQRALFWSEASSFFARVTTAQRPAAASSSSSIVRSTQPDAEAATGGAGFSEQRPESDQDRARRSVQALVHTLRHSSSAAQASAIWRQLATHRAVFTRDGRVWFAEGPVGDHKSDTDGLSHTHTHSHSSHSSHGHSHGRGVRPRAGELLLRMVSVAEHLEITKHGHGDRVLASLADDDGDDGSPGALPRPAGAGGVLLGGGGGARLRGPGAGPLGRPDAPGSFVETLERQRRDVRTHALLQTRADADDRAVVAAVVDGAVDERHRVDALYVGALGRLQAHSKIVKRVAPLAADLSPFLRHRPALQAVLSASAMERHGALARALVDQAADAFPALTLSARQYTTALHACLRVDPKTPESLAHALQIYRRMTQDAGYVLAPTEWSMLFNASVYLADDAAAVELFAAYPQHCIAPFQTRFVHALRTACRFERFDAVPQLIDAWTAADARLGRTQAETASASASAAEAEATCLNKILWEMLKRSPSVAQLSAVLHRMEARHAAAGAIVVRRLVDRFFSELDGDRSPVRRFLDVWEACPSVIQRTPFVLHLLVSECMARAWEHECEALLAYAVAHGMALPMPTTVVFLEQLAARGELARVALLGDMIVDGGAIGLCAPPSAAASSALHEEREEDEQDKTREQQHYAQFFELLLKCHLFRERYEDVVRIAERCELAARFPHHATLAAMVRDAESML